MSRGRLVRLPGQDGFTARRARGAQTRRVILMAAERVFAEAGYGGARTELIADRAGVNKALLYYYFKSKDGLHRAILEEHLKEFQRQVVQALSFRGSARAKLIAYVSTHFDFISTRPYYPRLIQRVMMTGGKPMEGLAQRFFVPLLRKLVSVLESGVRQREFRRLDCHQTALSLISLVVFYFSSAPILSAVTHIDPYENSQLTRRKAEVMKFIRLALFKKGKGSKA